MTNDLVSDMLTRIRNANMVRHTFVYVCYSKLNLAILKLLTTEGYIKSYILETFQVDKKRIKIYLKYKGWWLKKPLFSILKRISKPGQRVFSGYKYFQSILNVLKYNQGIAIISTSAGIMNYIKAQKLKKGGEILFYIE